jgi:hypothetical protein
VSRADIQPIGNHANFVFLHLLPDTRGETAWEGLGIFRSKKDNWKSVIDHDNS